MRNSHFFLLKFKILLMVERYAFLSGWRKGECATSPTPWQSYILRGLLCQASEMYFFSLPEMYKVVKLTRDVVFYPRYLYPNEKSLWLDLYYSFVDRDNFISGIITALNPEVLVLGDPNFFVEF